MKNKWLEKLFQPFKYIDGWKAQVIGMIGMLLSASFAYAINFRFDGLIDFHGYADKSSVHLLDIFMSWIMMTLGTIIIGSFAKKKFRRIDVLGMMAFAFLPRLLQPTFTYVFGIHNLALMNASDHTVGELLAALQPNMLAIVFSSIFQLVAMVWHIYWMYTAFQINLNFKQDRSKIYFAMLVIAIELLSLILIRLY